MSSKNSHDKDFKQYRDIAPEAVDDAKLREVINKYSGNQDKILAAIENMWHDLPEKQAVGSEWESASKPKKGVPVETTSGRGRGRSVESGRGGAGRGDRGGRSASAAGRGKDHSARVASKPAEKSQSQTSTTSWGSAPSSWGASTSPVPEAASAAPAAHAPAPVVAPVAAAAVAPAAAVTAARHNTTSTASTASTAATGKTAWGSGGSLAEKLKRQHELEQAELLRPQIVEVVVTEVVVVDEQGNNASTHEPNASRGGKRRQKGKGGSSSHVTAQQEAAEESQVIIEEITEALEEVMIAAETAEAAETFNILEEVALETIEAIMSLHNPVSEGTENFIEAQEEDAQPSYEERTQTETVEEKAAPVAFVKLGKWETPLEVAEGGAFQFGSFGNYSSEETSGNVSNQGQVSSAWGNSEPHGGDAGVWSSSNNSGHDSSLPPGMNSLFPSHGNKGLDTGRFDQKPPGLDSHQHNKAGHQQHQGPRSVAPGAQQGRGKHETAPQSQHQQFPHHQQHQYPHQGYQPAPGSNLGGRNPGQPGPGYYPGFDIPPAQYMQQPSYGGPVAGSAAVGSAAGSANTTATSSASTNTTTSTAQQQQQQQQFAPPPGMAAPYGYYPPPYYNQFYYNQNNMPYYNNQGRGAVYPNRGQYPDPYASGGSLYPDVYQGQGQFGDSNYGAPMHPGMQQSGQGQSSSAGGAVGAANSSNKQQTKPANAPTGNQQGSSHLAQDHSSHPYGYMPYNPRTEPWQPHYQGHQPQWMPFPSSGPAGTQGQNQSQSNAGFNQTGGNMGSSLPQQGQGQQGNRENRNAPGTGVGGTGGYGSSYGNRNAGAPTNTGSW